MLSTFSYTCWPFGHLYDFFWEMCIHIFCLFFIWIIFLNVLLWNCMDSVYILDINLLLDIWFASISSHSTGCLLFYWILSLLCRNFLAWHNPIRLFLLLLPLLLVSYPKKSLPRPVSRSFSSMLSFSNFIISGLMFKALIHFELIFVYVVR